MHKLLVIQTAFTGDVVLATAVLEKVHFFYPASQIDILVRKGNEGLLAGHPFVKNLLVWDKKNNKNKNLFNLILKIRKEKYSHIVNIHRFGSSGLLTMLSGAGCKIGFDKNPFSFCYDKKVKHVISEPFANDIIHEVDRNQLLIAGFTDNLPSMPKLYPSQADINLVKQYNNMPYICIAPSSVWFTKQFPVEKWVSLINEIPKEYAVFILGGQNDSTIADSIINLSEKREIVSMCGKFNYLQSAALMGGAVMNYVNDSAPLHFASAMNAPVTAVFCSTVPAFGFGPLRENGKIVEINERIGCRPCGLHGHKTCPQGHFDCAFKISNRQLLWWIPSLR